MSEEGDEFQDGNFKQSSRPAAANHDVARARADPRGVVHQDINDKVQEQVKTSKDSKNKQMEATGGPSFKDQVRSSGPDVTGQVGAIGGPSFKDQVRSAGPDVTGQVRTSIDARQRAVVNGVQELPGARTTMVDQEVVPGEQDVEYLARATVVRSTIAQPTPQPSFLAHALPVNEFRRKAVLVFFIVVAVTAAVALAVVLTRGNGSTTSTDPTSVSTSTDNPTTSHTVAVLTTPYHFTTIILGTGHPTVRHRSLRSKWDGSCVRSSIPARNGPGVSPPGPRK